MELLTAIAIGFFGSFHCVGMCGPIAIALPVPNSRNLSFFYGRILYNLGRVISYSMLGATFGFLGKGLKLYGYQQGLSIFLGVIIILIIVTPLKYKNRVYSNSTFQKMSLPVKSSISSLFKKGTLPSLLLIGILNGFLPCGFVYMGLAGSLASGSITNGIMFMLFFGLGTIPAMLTISLFGKFITLNQRKRIRKLTPILALLLALIFILRGLNLGIPYLSPKFEKSIQHSRMLNTNLKYLNFK